MLERWNLSNTRQFPSQLKMSLQISVGAIVRSMGWKLYLINHRTDGGNEPHTYTDERPTICPLVCLEVAYTLYISQECDEYAIAHPSQQVPRLHMGTVNRP